VLRVKWIGKCRVARPLALFELNSKNTSQLFIGCLVFGSFDSSICHCCLRFVFGGATVLVV
jgi:hypothetical protein